MLLNIKTYYMTDKELEQQLLAEAEEESLAIEDCKAAFLAGVQLGLDLAERELTKP